MLRNFSLLGPSHGALCQCFIVRAMRLIVLHVQSTVFYFHTFSLQAAINDRVQSASVQPVSTDLVS